MIFLTGATGLVGGFLARALVNDGLPVTALVRKNSDLSLLDDIKEKISWLEGDILDMPFLLRNLKNFDLIIHAAALVSYLPRHKKLIYKTNVEGTSNLVNAAIENNIPGFFHISSIATIGRIKGIEVLNEDISFVDSPQVSNYGKSKYLAEMEVFRGLEEGLKVCIVNPSIILGPGNWLKGSTQIFKYVFEENKYYSSGKLNFIDVRDVCSIVLQLIPILEKVSGERFILNAGQTTYQNFFSMIAERFNVRKPPYEAGPFLKSFAWRFEALKSIFSKKDPLVTRETASIGKFQYYYDNSKISGLLNFKFRSLEETVNWTCEELVKRRNNNAN